MRYVRIDKESGAQEALMQWAKLREHYYPELALLFHIPNGGKRDSKEAAHLKRQGVKAGVPDLFLPVARCGWHGLFIELKVGNNKQTKSQIQWQKDLSAQGYLSVCCWGWQSAQELIEDYLKGKVTWNE